jgi:4-hydroxybenzoate polyprenyltransferase
MKVFLQLIKVKHWVKNLFFILAPLVFSLQMFSIGQTLQALLAFVAFSMVTVFVYILNDILDRENDREHPQKSSRPIASGRVKPSHALILGILFAAIGFFIATFINIASIIIIGTYLLLNIAYSFLLKRVVILDVFIIAIGFCLRVLLGSVAIDVHLGPWMLLTTFSVSLILGFGKRRHELSLLGEEAIQHRTSLGEYSRKLLDMMIVIATSITAISYALYTMDNQVITRLGTDKLIFTIPFVLFGLFRYLYLIYNRGKGGSPEEIVVTDPGIVISVILWLVSIVLLIYFHDSFTIDLKLNALFYIQKNLPHGTGEILAP